MKISEARVLLIFICFHLINNDANCVFVWLNMKRIWFSFEMLALLTILILKVFIGDRTLAKILTMVNWPHVTWVMWFSGSNVSSEWVVLNTKYQKRVEYDEMGIPFYEMVFIYRNVSSNLKPRNFKFCQKFDITNLQIKIFRGFWTKLRGRNINFFR